MYQVILTRTVLVHENKMGNLFPVDKLLGIRLGIHYHLELEQGNTSSSTRHDCEGVKWKVVARVERSLHRAFERRPTSANSRYFQP